MSIQPDASGRVVSAQIEERVMYLIVSWSGYQHSGDLGAEQTVGRIRTMPPGSGLWPIDFDGVIESGSSPSKNKLRSHGAALGISLNPCKVT